jgi:hypothetical protein
MNALVEAFRYSLLPMRLITDHLSMNTKDNEQLLAGFLSDYTVYVKVSLLSGEKVNKEMVYHLIGRLNDLPSRPCMILTTKGFTRGAWELALENGIQLLTFRELADLLRRLEQNPADRRIYNIRLL